MVMTDDEGLVSYAQHINTCVHLSTLLPKSPVGEEVSELVRLVHLDHWGRHTGKTTTTSVAPFTTTAR